MVRSVRALWCAVVAAGARDICGTVRDKCGTCAGQVPDMFWSCSGSVRTLVGLIRPVFVAPCYRWWLASPPGRPILLFQGT